MNQEEIETALAANNLPDLESLLDDLDFASGFAKIPDHERSKEQREKMDRIFAVVKSLQTLGIYEHVVARWRGAL